MRFPFRVKLIFGIGAITTPSERARLLAELYIACAPEQTAPFLEAFRYCSGGNREILPGNAILLNGVVQNANREIGFPGFQPLQAKESSGLFFAATVLFLPSLAH